MRFFVRNVLLLPALIAVAASVSSLPMAGASELGADWTVRNPVRLHSDMLDIAVNGSSNMVAVGSHGTIVSGNDLSTLALVPSGVTDDFLNVTFAGGKYYTAGNRGHILSSSNSTTWSVKYSSLTDIYQCVAGNSSVVMAAGAYLNGSTFNNVVMTSTDGGVNWTRRTFPNMSPLTRIVWNGQMFVGIMYGATATSLDGSSWSVHALPLATATGTAATRSIVWTGSTYLVSGDSVWRSTNGVVWTEYAALLNGASGAYLSWTGNELLISLGSHVYSTTDLATLADRSTGQLCPETYGIRFGSSIVMAGLGGHVDSQDGNLTWSPRFSAGLTAAITGMAKNASVYVAVALGATWTSTDANNWTEHALSGKSFISAAWSGTQFVACGSGIWTSPDGVTWTNAVPVDANGYEIWTMVSWAGGKGFASGYNASTGAVLTKTSLDGTTWSAGSMTQTVLGLQTSGDGNRLVAVGLGGAAIYSTDAGATWQGGAVAIGSQDFNGLTFGNGKFFAVTSGGAIWSTPDGQTWDRLNVGSGILNSIVRTTNEFVAVGSSGRVLRSFDGKSWRFSDSKTSSTLTRLMFTNGRLIAAGGSANIITSDGDLPVQNTVQFSTATSSMTEGGSVGVVVTLSQESSIAVTVTLNYSGSAGTADFGGPGATVVIPAGETSAFMVFTATDNNVITVPAGDKSLVITLATPLGDVALGAPAEIVHTITIHDNDVTPAFDLHPADQLAALGVPVVFTAHATGSGNLAYQWKKNNVAILNANSESLTLAKAALTDAASYTVTVTGNVGTITSNPAKLGVVTVQSLVQVVKANATASFPATVKLPTPAPALTYQWRKGVQPLSIGGRITDATSKLTITGVLASDTDTYVCDVTMGSGVGAPTMTATTVDYTVLGTGPVITQPAPLATRVAATLDFTPVATGKPTKWTAAPLPPGTVLNTATGRISGKLTKGGVYNVKFTATNLVGPSTMTYAITVDALTPSTVGSFIALMERDSVVNTNLGGRLDVTTTATGTFSGKIKLPVTELAFTGALSGARGTNPTAVNVPVPKSNLLLTITINETTGVISASVNNGVRTIGGLGVERAAASALARAGAYNFAITPEDGTPSGTPQGAGYGQFTLAITGALKITGKLADGTTFATDTFTGVNGDIPFYAPSATGKGSVMGMLTLNEHSTSGFANNFITGLLIWYKNQEPTSRSYTNGIPAITLNADGGRYIAPPTTEIVMKLPTSTGNATLTFSGAGLHLASRNPTNAFTVVKPAKATLTPPATGPSNPAATTLSFTPSTGLFNGQFVLSDPDIRYMPPQTIPVIPRTVLYYGVLIRPGGTDVMEGRGFFTLPQMPVDNEMSSTSPILSGHVSLTRTALAPP